MLPGQLPGQLFLPGQLVDVPSVDILNFRVFSDTSTSVTVSSSRSSSSISSCSSTFSKSSKRFEKAPGESGGEVSGSKSSDDLLL